MQDDKLISLRQYTDSRLQSMKLERRGWWLHWRQLSDYLLPRRGRFLVTPNRGNRGDQVNTRILDSTGTLALNTLTSGLMAAVTSPARAWFRLSMRDSDASSTTPARLWLDEVQRRMLNVMSQSNLYNSIHVLYEELCSFGTAVVLVEEDFDDIIRCQTLTVGEYFLAVNGKLEPDTLYREYVMTVQQLVDRFGEENVSDSVCGLWKSKQLDKEIMVCQAIEPNDDRCPQVMGVKGKPYRSVWWEQGQTQSTVLEVKGYYEKPFAAVRWHVAGNDAYGRSPGMEALPDIKMLQVMQKRKAQAIDKVVNPPMVGSVAMRNEPASLLPGGITFTPGSTAEGFKPAYQVPPNIMGLLEDIKETQNRINRAFFADLFLMISQLDNVRTATEIAERKQEKMLMLGPVYERMTYELIEVVIDRTFNIMLRQGLLPEPPQEVHNVPLDVQVISPLADAQRSVGTTGIERLWAFAGNIAALKPEVLDNLDTDKTIDAYADMLGTTPKIIVPDDQVEASRKERAKQAQAAQAGQAGLATAQGAKVLSEVDTGGGQNAIQRMLGTV